MKQGMIAGAQLLLIWLAVFSPVSAALSQEPPKGVQPPSMEDTLNHLRAYLDESPQAVAECSYPETESRKAGGFSIYNIQVSASGCMLTIKGDVVGVAGRGKWTERRGEIVVPLRLLEAAAHHAVVNFSTGRTAGQMTCSLFERRADNTTTPPTDPVVPRKKPGYNYQNIGTYNSYNGSIRLRDGELAERASRALNHAAELCRQKARSGPDPFKSGDK